MVVEAAPLFSRASRSNDTSISLWLRTASKPSMAVWVSALLRAAPMTPRAGTKSRHSVNSTSDANSMAVAILEVLPRAIRADSRAAE